MSFALVGVDFVFYYNLKKRFSDREIIWVPGSIFFPFWGAVGHEVSRFGYPVHSTIYNNLLHTLEVGRTRGVFFVAFIGGSQKPRNSKRSCWLLLLYHYYQIFYKYLGCLDWCVSGIGEHGTGTLDWGKPFGYIVLGMNGRIALPC